MSKYEELISKIASEIIDERVEELREEKTAEEEILQSLVKLAEVDMEAAEKLAAAMGNKEKILEYVKNNGTKADLKKAKKGIEGVTKPAAKLSGKGKVLAAAGVGAAAVGAGLAANKAKNQKEENERVAEEEDFDPVLEKISEYQAAYEAELEKEAQGEELEDNPKIKDKKKVHEKCAAYLEHAEMLKQAAMEAYAEAELFEAAANEVLEEYK